MIQGRYVEYSQIEQADLKHWRQKVDELKKYCDARQIKSILPAGNLNEK